MSGPLVLTAEEEALWRRNAYIGNVWGSMDRIWATLDAERAYYRSMVETMHVGTDKLEAQLDAARASREPLTDAVTAVIVNPDSLPHGGRLTRLDRNHNEWDAIAYVADLHGKTLNGKPCTGHLMASKETIPEALAALAEWIDKAWLQANPAEPKEANNAG